MKAIENVFIGCSGDPSVGIPSCSFEASVYILRDDVEFIEDMRRQFERIYEAITDFPVKVLFDYEVERLQELEQDEIAKADMAEYRR